MKQIAIVWLGALALVVGAGLGCTTTEGGGDGSGAGSTAPPLAGAGAGGLGGVGGAGGAGTGGSAAGAGGTGGAAGMTAGAGGAAGMAGAAGAGTGGMAGMAGAAGAGAGGMAGMSAGSGGAGGGAFELTSTAVENDAMLPAEFRCASLFGDPGPSPPLTWTAGPTGTMSYTLVFKDTSPAGTTGAGTFHWIIKDIPVATMSLPEAVPVGAMPAAVPGATQIMNGILDVGYRGPCGGMNDYTFTLYAVNKASISATTAATVETEAMANNVGTATLVIHSAPP